MMHPKDLLLFIEAPYFPEDLIEEDFVAYPQAVVSSLAGFTLDMGDEIQMLEGLGDVCDTFQRVAMALGPLATPEMRAGMCSAITDGPTRGTCIGAARTAPSIASFASTVCAALRSRPTTPSTAELERRRLEAERARLAAERAAAAKPAISTTMLVGGTIAAAGLVALLAFRR